MEKQGSLLKFKSYSISLSLTLLQKKGIILYYKLLTYKVKSYNNTTIKQFSSDVCQAHKTKCLSLQKLFLKVFGAHTPNYYYMEMCF